MRILALLIFFVSSIFSTTITNHNIYKQDDSIDLMLTFDEPYLGKISKKREDESTILMLNDIKIEKSFTQKISSTIVQQIQILPYKNQIFIKVQSQKPYEIEASKTIDNYGLRIRVKTKKALQTLKTAKFETKKEDDLTGSFLKVIAVLGFLILLLYLLKRWIANSNNVSNSWLFNKNSDKKKDIKLLQQKSLDRKNRVALLEYDDINYLVILGDNNLLLDKFKTKDSNQEFDTLLKKNGQKLDKILQSNDQ